MQPKRPQDINPQDINRPGLLLRKLVRSQTSTPDLTTRPTLQLAPVGESIFSRLRATVAPTVASAPQAMTSSPSRQVIQQQATAPSIPRCTKSNRSAPPSPTGENLSAKTLKSLQLSTPALALLCAPSDFLDCRNSISRIRDIPDETPVMLYLRKTGRIWGFDAQRQEVRANPYESLYDAAWPTHWRHITQLRIELVDEDNHLLYMSVFGGWNLRNQDPTSNVLIHGVLKAFGQKTFITKAEQIPDQAFGVVYPRYATPGSTTSEAGVRQIVSQALSIADAPHLCVNEIVRKTLLSEQQMLTIARVVTSKFQSDDLLEPAQEFKSMAQLLLAMHQPQTLRQAHLAVACARAIAIEGICHAARQANERAPHPQSPIALTPSIILRVIQSQTEQLTSDQSDVVEQICRALQSPTPLTSLLSGDVGTGKTLTFAIPCVAAHLSGAKVAILVPTEILANQAHVNLSRRFPFAKVERVITGKKILDQSAILVGTSGLCTIAAKCGYQPNVLVIDEQHKLSTDIRKALCAAWTHLIEASATPIPRSLASSLFAGMRVFNLATAPVKRSIHSALLDESARPEITRILRNTITSAARVAFIYPRVQVSTNAAQNSVLLAAQTLEQHFPGKVSTLHGKMKSNELADALEQFRSGSTPILVSSTVMETGIDIPDIRLLVVRDADNFGAAQLHQLRGRLARNGGTAHFIMLVKDLQRLNPETTERLEMVCSTMDGYALAEADMKQRGIGDLAGDAQSGSSLSPIRLLNIGISDFSGYTIKQPFASH